MMGMAPKSNDPKTLMETGRHCVRRGLALVMIALGLIGKIV